MSDLSNLEKWQLFMAEQVSKNPDAFKKAVLFQASRSDFKRRGLQEVYALLAVKALIKGEQK